MIDRKIALLRYVSRRGSFSRAARDLGVSQSTISRDISLLESMVHASLFERHRDGVTLTPAARHLRGLIFGKMDDRIIADCRRVTEGRLPQLQLAAGTQAAILLQPVLNRLTAMGLDMPIQLSIYKNSDIRLLLKTGQVDIGFLLGRESVRDPGLALLPLCSPRWLVAARQDHPYWSMPAADRAVLLRQTVIINREHLPDTSNALDAATRYCVDQGLPFQHFLRANFLQDQILMLQTGEGISLMPPFTREHVPPEIRFSDELAVPFAPEWTMCYREESLHPGVQILKDLCLECLGGEHHA